MFAMSSSDFAVMGLQENGGQWRASMVVVGTCGPVLSVVQKRKKKLIVNANKGRMQNISVSQ